ncbi:tryptophan 2,3-dioxygenase family protein [Actinophytocola oryzae]|uniref:Tryptophan 2,3-dioxygenase n=1 Tax=Actinophytocola oryzae TaxID=502181 RepID=A0A4R7UYD8_9PSEU|nr:tryptophan 2,3-dioxygenase family protein [Actinophytocola oryzae]TDV41102.1 tryptophan 2,3-dioxygenase [Actinophytocola oryzae]
MLPTYSEYLRLPELLGQRHPRSTEHDELLFITVHQTCELWFRQMLTELTAARDDLLAGETYPPRSRLRRCHTIARMLATHFDVLDTMAPQDFLRFRDALGTASGLQSAQFRQIELLSARGGREPTLWDGFLTVLGKAGFSVATRAERSAAYGEIAMNRREHQALWELAEALVDHDQAWSMFRQRHVHTVERQIGSRPGTGGTAGAVSLTGRGHFYPELWELRASL